MSQLASPQLVVFGNTLAASMTVLALTKALPNHSKIHWIRPQSPCLSDVLYGGITSPEAYHFNLQLGVSEPELILNTDTTFTFGSHFTHWGTQQRNWMQCFHLPFATTSGVELHHFMTRHNATLADYLISAQAALKGTFAHPPVDNPHSPLSRAEYGYHFEPTQWSALYLDKITQTNVAIIHQGIRAVHANQEHIKAIELDDGSHYQADLFIDCSGTNSQLVASLPSDFNCQRQVQLLHETKACAQTGPACRSVTGNQQGWQAVTPLREKNQLITLIEASEAQVQATGQTVALGYRPQAWHGNCVALGHAAYAFEPVTPAPYLLLKKDIERLLELIPLGRDCAIERREYNRRYYDDVIHAELFHRALYAQQRDVGYDNSPLLDRKLSQYDYRGILTSFDFEPFNQQDWAILHAGLGRIPQRYDRMAEQVDVKAMQTQLNTMQAGLAHLAAKMPPHHLYLQKLSTYLRESQKHG